MATVLSCGACHYPIIFRGVAPGVMAEKEMEVVCPECGAAYNVLIRMIRVPVPAELEMAKVRHRGE